MGYFDALRSKFPSLKFKSGHGMCHPETCSCWNIRVYDGAKNICNSDCFNEVEKFCDRYTVGQLTKEDE